LTQLMNFLISTETTDSAAKSQETKAKFTDQETKEDKLTNSYKIELWGRESGIPIYKTSENPILYESLSCDIKKEMVLGVPGAFILHSVLTKKECQQYIEITEKFGYQKAAISYGSSVVVDSSIRSNKRVIWQTSENIWKPIWKRVESLVPETLTKGPEGLELSGTWNRYSLNERFRFYRYDGGEKFAPHFDGCFPRNEKERSFITFILYLNDGFEGGRTTFWPTGFAGKKVAVNPLAGSALLFFHAGHLQSPLHEGSVCKDGRKYVLRSDVMYRRTK